jgi:hypothetical protein
LEQVIAHINDDRSIRTNTERIKKLSPLFRRMGFKIVRKNAKMGRVLTEEAENNSW